MPNQQKKTATKKKQHSCKDLRKLEKWYYDEWLPWYEQNQPVQTQDEGTNPGGPPPPPPGFPPRP